MEQDQTDAKHHKHLRDMFRLFQRAKRQKEKAKERTEEGSRESKASVRSQHSRRIPSSSDKRQSKSPTQAPSPSKETTKSPSKKKSEVMEESSDDDEPADETASAKKRRLIRKKYGIQLKDDDFVQRECKEEMEEFENVAVALRPAATKMRKAKLRWKAASPAKKDIEEEETLESPTDVTGSGWEESMSFASESDFTDTHDEDKNLNEKYAKRYAALKANPKENVERLLKELHTLFLRVDELEQLEKTYLEQIQELKKQLAVKDEKISELSRKIEEGAATAKAHAIPAAIEKEFLVEKTVEEEVSVPPKIEKEAVWTKTVEKEKETIDVAKKEKSMKTSSEGEKMIDKLEAIAKRGLDILNRNQLLEQTLNDNEAQILFTFFESDEAKPDKKVVDLIDKALSYGVEVLLTRPDLFEDFVDNELRLFLIDVNKAKRILLDCMLLHPQYVPTKWGGDIMRKRQREGLDKKTEKSEEKSRQNKTTGKEEEKSNQNNTGKEEEKSNQNKTTGKEEEKSNQNKTAGKEEEKSNQNKTTGKEEEKSNQNKTAGKEEEKNKMIEETVKMEVEKSKQAEASTVQAAIQTTKSIFDYLVGASKWAASTSTKTAPSASFSKEKSTAGQKTIERKTLPKSDKSESKTESENKIERDMKEQPKLTESKTEDVARISIVGASKRAASTSTKTAPSAPFSKEKSTAGQKTIERKTLPKSDKSESKTESENKIERDMKEQPKLTESKTEDVARISIVGASKRAASTSTKTAPSAPFSKEKSTARQKTIEMKTLPYNRSESKTESENKIEREMKAQPKPSESKSGKEARSRRQASLETVRSRAKERKEQGTRDHGKGWKCHKSGSESPANSPYVKDRKRHSGKQAKVKHCAKKKN